MQITGYNEVFAFHSLRNYQHVFLLIDFTKVYVLWCRKQFPHVTVQEVCQSCRMINYQCCRHSYL